MENRMRRTCAAFVVALVTVVLALTISAQRPPAATLTPMDYVEIRQLVNRSAFAIDTGSNSGYDYADLFAEDGESVRPNAKGRDQLAARARAGARTGPENTTHYVMNHVIEPTAEGAIGKESVVELNWDLANGGAGARGGGPVSGWDLVGRKAGEVAGLAGHFDDVYVRTPTGWRFKRRTFVPSRGNTAPADSPVTTASVTPPSKTTLTTLTTFVAPTKQTALTALDYLEIAQLVASYGHALDSGFGKGENGEAYANLYTDEAAFAGAEGHAQLVKLGQIQPRGPDYVRHYLTNHVIEPAPGGASGREYLAVIDVGEGGKPGSLFLGGHYEDSYVKTPAGWRISARRLITPRSGPQPPRPAPPAPVASRSSAAGRNALTLSPMDYIDIQQLMARSAADREFTTNYVVQPSADGATGRVYGVSIEIGERGTPGSIRGGGHYDDVYVKTGGVWKSKQRTFVPSRLGARGVYQVDGR
jgi:hypothetical protein